MYFTCASETKHNAGGFGNLVRLRKSFDARVFDRFNRRMPTRPNVEGPENPSCLSSRTAVPPFTASYCNLHLWCCSESEYASSCSVCFFEWTCIGHHIEWKHVFKSLQLDLHCRINLSFGNWIRAIGLYEVHHRTIRHCQIPLLRLKLSFSSAAKQTRIVVITTTNKGRK